MAHGLPGHHRAPGRRLVRFKTRAWRTSWCMGGDKFHMKMVTPTGLPSGKRFNTYGKSSFLMGKLTNYKWPFSIVNSYVSLPEVVYFFHLFSDCNTLDQIRYVRYMFIYIFHCFPVSGENTHCTDDIW